MLYYTNEMQMDEGRKQTAGIKARDDIVEIFRQMEIGREIQIVIDERLRQKGSPIHHFAAHMQAAEMWDAKLSTLRENDYIFIQYPLVNHSIFFSNVLRKLRNRHVRIIVLIHDLELLRSYDHNVSSRFRIQMEEISVLKESDYIIVHNKRMKKVLSSRGFDRQKIFTLGIFDYLIPDFEKRQRPAASENSAIIAGNLKPVKAGYAYHLPDDFSFHLYGVGYNNPDAAANVKYFGSFEPEELPFVMDGTFGLVWDGDRADTCSGTYGRYLKINNPHKTSLYLASGIPVIIWEKAALAGFVKKHGCGVTVDSLEQLHDTIHSISESQYQQMRENTSRVGKRLRNGYYTKRVIRSILSADTDRAEGKK